MSESFPTPITSKKILVVEGKDEINFFDSLLKYLNITDYQIEEGGGKNQFHKKIPALKLRAGFIQADGTSFVTHLAIIRDKNGDNALGSVREILKKEDFIPPENHGQFSNGKPKVGIFIMPGNTIEGTMLEDLCLKTVENHPAMECVNKFASCVSKLPKFPKNISKSKATVFKAQVFLATQPDSIDSVGLGAQKHYWDFESAALDELKEFLKNLE